MVEFACSRGVKFTDRDEDQLLLDDILRSKTPNADKLRCMAEYLVDLSANESVFANSDPTDPRKMKWSIDGKDSFVLTKTDGNFQYEDISGDKLVGDLGSGYGLLFGLNPWFVRGDLKNKVDPLAIRSASYWTGKYSQSASSVIIPDAGEFNAVSSKNVDKIDSRLTELPDKMKRADVMDLIYRSFMLGSNTHITGEPAQGLGSGGFIYTGDLDTKSPENIWTLGDWENVASAFGFETDVSQVEKGFKVDFTKAVGKEGEELQLGYGIIVNQADLRGIPSLKACYASPAASEDDACAFHRAHIEPVRILWKGNGWTFVKTQQEYGWVQDKDLAVATRADVDVLLNSPVVVKEFSFVRDDVRFDMGTSLPFGGDGENADWMAVLVPSKDDDGNVKWKKMSMPSEYVEVMPKYTYETVVNLLLGEMTEGIWLLANKSFKGVEGVDCSGATKKALEVAGLLLGRNSGSAQGLQGKSLWERPAGLVMEKQPEADPQKIQTTMDKNLKALQSSKDEIGAVFKKWHEDMLSGRPRGILLVGWNGHIGIFLGYDDAGRAVVFSSLSRVKRMNGASQPEDVWLLEPTITPLDTIETDPDNGQLITPGQGFPASWYGRITYVRELAE